MTPNIAEIHVIGTGGGYGESVIAHIGNDEWIVIDSCKDPNTGKSLPLEFIQQNNIDPEKIKLVVCTHWHDDHINGISDVVDYSPHALFSFARANDLKKFLRMISIDFEKELKGGSNSSTVEFNRCLGILKERGQLPVYASRDTLLYASELHGKSIEIHALSPSQKSNQIFDEEIGELITASSAPNKKLYYRSPNNRCVVLLLIIGEHTALLGTDLEAIESVDLGWNDITNNSQIIKIKPRSNYFKIPHHGSSNGFHQETWNQLLNLKPISTITPWNRVRRLP